MRIPFKERAISMGLQADDNAGLYSYSDRYSKIVYRQCKTGASEIQHPTDNQDIPIIGIFTSSPDSDEFKYVGCVSEIYKFIGNEPLNNSIVQSITSVGNAIVSQNALMSYDFTRIRNEIIIQNTQSVQQVGDIMPVMIVNNSYNGTKAASISFGLALNDGGHQLVFAFELGEMRQVHIASSSAEMRTAITSYMDIFSNDITQLVTDSFNTQVTEDQMLATLDLIEKVGKRKREEVSKLLEEITGQGQLPSAWQLFLAIVRYSSFEPNINLRKLLENAAESVLVIPARMYSVLEQLENL